MKPIAQDCDEGKKSSATVGDCQNERDWLTLLPFAQPTSQHAYLRSVSGYRGRYFRFNDDLKRLVEFTPKGGRP